MLGRNMLVALAVTALALGGCQKIWGFEDFEEGAAAGGSAGGGAGGSTGGVAGSGGASGGSAGAAPCVDGAAPGGMIGVRIQDQSCVWIDPKEVTRAEYETFRLAAPTPPSICNWNSSLDSPEKKQGTTPCLGPGETGDAGDVPGDLPVTCVDWCDAYSYCAHQNKVLCPGTINQAQKGAWFDVCSSNGANDYPYPGSFQADYCNDSSSSAKALVGVGTKTECKTPNGVYDMTGNASEWLDACSATTQAANCDTRGGNYNDSSGVALCKGANAVAKEMGLPGLGFRCCWLPM